MRKIVFLSFVMMVGLRHCLFLCTYVSYLANQHLKRTTIKVYLSVTRHLQIVAWPRLDQGINRVEAEKGTDKRERLPISPVILSKLKEAWSPMKDKYDTKMPHAACAFLHSYGQGR